MMTQLQILQMFWNDWGNHNLDFYKVYVQCGAISKDDYKTITGDDYQATVAASTTPVGTSTVASDSTAATSGTANVTPTA